MPQSIAGSDRKEVRRISARVHAQLPAVTRGLPPADAEERASKVGTGAEGPGGARAHTGEAVEAGAADEMKENGLRLVVQCMADGDGGGAGGKSLLT